MSHRLAVTRLLVALLGLASCPAARPVAEARSPDAAPRSAPPSRPTPEGVGAHLPYPSVAGWSMSEAAETYGAGDLERLVDGGADRYHRFGYRGAATAEYRSPAAPQAVLRVEVYDMGSHLGAFGLLAAEIAELGDPATAESPGVTELREAAVLGPGALSFFRGSLLVRLVLQDLSPEATEESLETLTQEHLPRVARELARSLPGTSEPPDELAVLPATGRVRRSGELHPEHLFGLERLGPGVSALYGDPGPRLRLGVPLGLDDVSARALFSALAAAQTDAAPVTEVGDEASAGDLAPLGRTVVARRGSRLVLVAPARATEPPRPSALESLARAALAPPEAAAANPPAPPRR